MQDRNIGQMTYLIEKMGSEAKYYQIELTKGRIALVSAEDLEGLSRYMWFVLGRGSRLYAARKGAEVNGKWPTILMHRQIAGFPSALYVDHINGNTLDNRRDNLRPATCTENLRNSRVRSDNKSGLKGVHRHKEGRWTSQIRVDRSKIHLGLFDTPEDAHAAYCEAAKKYFGDFARVA